MKTELISKMEELLVKEVNEVANDVRALQKEYQKIWMLEFEKARQTFIDEGGRSKEFEYHKQAEDLKFDSLIEKFNKLKKEGDAKIAAEQAKNLIVRQEIIAKLQDLRHTENVGAAIRKLQELQTQWKEAGAVSTHKYKEVQAEYSKAVEDIYYNLKIFRDLQEHDLKKNYESKKELIEKVKLIQQLDNIKEAERLIKVYRNEWEEIGPVPNMRWEALKAEYKTALDETYGKIKAHYNAVEEVKENNLQQKLAIIEKAKKLVDFESEDRVNKWNEITDQLIAFQAEWKTIGRAVEKDNEKVWAEFRQVCDGFFERKKVFYAGLNEKFAANRKIKSELISKAEALQHSTDWQKTGLDLIKLQEHWKKHPANGDKEEPKLFARFRKACNTFFDAKKAYYENLDASFENNLIAKEEILKRITEYKLGEDNKLNHEELMAFSAEWNNAGMVPMKDKKRVNEAFYNRLDELYETMNLEKQEKAIMQFKNKIERFSASENAHDLLRRESDYFKKQIDEINSRIRTYDNNLGFFKSSKGSNSFMKEIEEKIEAEKSKINELIAKRKLVNEEMSKLREAEKPRA